MRAERPSRIVRCEVLAAWRGLDLVARDGTWDLVPRPAAPGHDTTRGPVRATGLSLAEVEALLGRPTQPLPSTPRETLLHEVAEHLEAAEREAGAAQPGSRRRQRAEDVVHRLMWLHGELLAGHGDSVPPTTLQRVLAELVRPLLARDEDP